jgi:hypothetical protein
VARFGHELVGVLVIRAWVEEDGERRVLTARVRATNDLMAANTTTHAAGSVDEIIAIVHDWLHAFAPSR